MQILVKDLEAGQKYIFQARAKNSAGATSQWSTAFTANTVSDTIPPGAATDLTWDVEGTAFVATWEKPLLDSNGKPLKDFRDYKVIISAGSQDIVYFVTQEKFDLTFEANRNSFGSPEPTVDISVQARDLTGNLSTAVTASASNPVPDDVTGFVADGIAEAVYLTWDANTDPDLKYYQVYVSTSGSGFTPGPSNITYTGSSNVFTFSTTNFVPHYFKIHAVDVFNQGSASYASATATPSSSAGIDLTPPDDPTSVTVASNETADGYATLEVDWTAVGSSNLSDYIVRYSLDEVVWIYVTVPSNETSAVIDGILPDTDYYVQVAAMSYANVKSDFVNATPYPITTAADTSAPSQPAAPSISVSTLMAQVSHDMTKQGGGDLEDDVIYLEVHASVTTGFTPSNSTLRGTINTAGPGIDVSGVFYFAATDSTTNLYWKVIAVDRAKNKSAASNQATGVPGLIENQHIVNATITSAKIQDLEANKITAGTGIINALTVKNTLTIGTSGHVRSTNWNGVDTGWSLDETGLVIYGGSISAAALLLQDSNNIIPPAFADFEFNDDYYHASGVANSVVMSTVGTGVLVGTSSTNRFGTKSLRLSNGVITNPTVHDLIFAPSGLSATGVNIDVSPGTYIFSGYFKKNGSVNALLKFAIYTDAAATVISSASTVNSTSWTRFEAQLIVPSGVSKVKAYLEFGPAAANTGYDFLVDGLQFERKMTATTTAGIWKPPSSTAIDGGQIVTGSIRSSAASSVVPSQPAWSINTAGNMQIGNALVRGSMTVGDASSPVNQMPSQFTSFEETSSYYHDGSNVQNATNFHAVDLASTPNTKLQIITDPVFDTQALRIWETAAPVSLSSRSIVFSTIRLNTGGNNINVIAGEDYYISAYFKNRDITKHVKVGFAIYSNPAHFGSAMGIVGGDVDISAATAAYTRVYGRWTAPSGSSNCQVALFITPISGSTGFDISMDGMMFEIEKVGQSTPSTYTNTIGEISYIRSGNYISGFSGWSIGNDGAAEFNDGYFRGQLDIETFFNDVAYGTNISNQSAVWKSSVWTSFDYEISGVEPAIKFTGTGFRPTDSGGLAATNPFQVVFRGSPEGGYQLMFDGSSDSKIFDIDANNDLDVNYDPIDDTYGYSDFRSGRGYSRGFSAAAAQGLFTNNNLFYTELTTKTQTPQSMYSENKTGLWSQTDASTLSYDYKPFAITFLQADSTVHLELGNIIPDPWDIFDGVIATYNTNSAKNRITLNSIGSFGADTAPLTSSAATSGLIKGINATWTSAGTGDSLIWLAATSTTYNVTVEPGCEYSMGMQFSFPTSMIGKQFQFMMKFSSGSTVFSNLVTLGSSTTTIVAPTYLIPNLSMGYANVFTVPAGITSCVVGFKIIGGVASNTNFGFGGGLLYKTREANGDYLSQYSKSLQVQREYESHYHSDAWVKVGALGIAPDIFEDGDMFGNQMSIVKLYAEQNNILLGTTKSFSLDITPDGMRWGPNTEYRRQYGAVMESTASVTIPIGTTILPLGTTTPTVRGLTSSRGQGITAQWNDNASVTENPSSAGWRYVAPRAGLVAVSGYAFMTGTGAAGATPTVFLQVRNLTTAFRYSIDNNTTGAHSIFVMVPVSAGDRVVVESVNNTNTKTMTECAVSFAQVI